MKAPRFWYSQGNDPVSVMAALGLAPFSYLFRAGACIRKAFADPYLSRVPVICVGNAVAGGAGKTPTAIAIAKMLKNSGHSPCFVTRGYGGSGELTCVDLARHTSDDVGDEALLLASVAPTWAARDRVEAVQQAEKYGSHIIMDDGLQNPNVTPSKSILVIDGESGIGNGHVIPAGPLREPFADALGRADAVVIIGDADRQNLAALAKVPVFRAKLKPVLPQSFPHGCRFIAFAGIARPEKFFDTAQRAGLEVSSVCSFPDHHKFSDSDLESLRMMAEEQGAVLLTTEKDAARLPRDFRDCVAVLPVELVFDSSGIESIVSGRGNKR